MSRSVQGVRAVLALAVSIAVLPVARAGHEFPFYPSYYPQEMTISVVPAADAATKVADASLHAYVGADPFQGGATPPPVARVESLDAYVLVTLNVAASFFPDPGRRCRAARAVADALAWNVGARRHPYPVTPYHPDYLQHADLAQTAGAGASAWDGAPLRIRAADPVAQALVPAAHRAGTGPWDAVVETREVAALWAEAALGPNGDVGPHWLKAGWSHAYLVLRDAIVDGSARQRVDALHERLASGRVDRLAERLDLERRLVSSLGQGCERTVAGYTLRAEPLNVDYSAGVENVAHDSQAGLGSAIFPRTVKLKDFPWNGWLTVGVPTGPRSAWNPVAGISKDATGRLVWLALGDPAFFPSPHGVGWIPNRVVVAEVELGTPALSVPEDAVAPEIGTGVWRKVGAGRQARARVLYRVLGSRFHDGTALHASDLLYALGFALRAKEPAVARATARLRDGIVGLRVLRVETDVLAFGDDKLSYEVPIVEVFVARGGEPDEVALVAPPWTTIPWHVLALSEEAVGRGLATFSREAALARGLSWLDLARDRALVGRLRALLDELAQRGHVPPALAGLVTPAEARARWDALRAFHDAAGHLFVTNGPYRLASWTDGATVLQVFRDFSYPRGVGVFNRYALPLHAHVTASATRGDTLILRGDIERVERFGREQRIVREPFVKRAVEQDRRSLPVAHWVAVGPDGAVAAAGSAVAVEPGDFPIDLSSLTRRGRYTVLVALTVDDNRTNLPVKALPWTR